MSENVTHTDFSALDAIFEERKSDAEACIARWLWASRGAHWEVPLPHYAEISGFGPIAAPLKREPADWQTAEHYGLDGEERIVVSRSYREKGVVTYEKFLHYGAEHVESVTYEHDLAFPDAPPKARAASRTVLADGRAVEYTTVNREGERNVEVPAWSGDVLTALTVTSSRDGQDRESVETYTYQYDDAGELVVIRAESDGAVLYRRPPKRLKPVLDLIERGLVAAIVRAVAEHRPEGPVAAIGPSGSTARPGCTHTSASRASTTSSSRPTTRTTGGARPT